MTDRIPEGFDRLSGKKSTGAVRDRPGNHDWEAGTEFLEKLDDAKQRGLGIERVENRFEKQNVDSPIDKGACLSEVGLAQDFERDIPESGIVDIRRHRSRPVGRAHHPGDKAGPPVPGLSLHRSVSGYRCSTVVELVDQAGHIVVGLRNRVRIERVRLSDIRSGTKVLRMDIAQQLRPGKGDNVVVSSYFPAVLLKTLPAELGFSQFFLLNHRPHCAIEDEDPGLGFPVQPHSAFVSCQFAASSAGAPTAADTGLIPRMRQVAEASSGRFRV